MFARSGRENDGRSFFLRGLSVDAVASHIRFGQVVIIDSLAFIASVARKRCKNIEEDQYL